MKRIMFVDDSTQVLDGLRRMLHKMKDKWTMDFVESGREALEKLAQEEYDAVISDMRMPEMNGAQLLNEIKNRYPGIVRFILSGHSDRELIMQSVGCTHQFLAKPCSPDLLVSTVQSSFSLRERVLNEDIRRKIAEIPSLPTLPTTYNLLVQALSDENTSLQTVSNIIAADVGMTTKILQLINSAFFGLPRRVENPMGAVSLLGLETIRTLVLAAGVFDQFKVKGDELVWLESIYMHSIAVGTLAHKYARLLRLDKKIADNALLAGTMHDIGKPVLLLHFPKLLEEARGMSKSRSIPMEQAEKEACGVSHATIGAYLLSLWGESDSIVETVAYHHDPSLAPIASIGELTAVHLANVLQRDPPASEDGISSFCSLDKDYLTRLGLIDRLQEFIGCAVASSTA